MTTLCKCCGQEIPGAPTVSETPVDTLLGELAAAAMEVAAIKPLRLAFCEALCDGWHADWSMARTVHRAYVIAGIDTGDQSHMYRQAAEALKVRYVHAHDRTQAWIARYLRDANEAFWRGAPRTVCMDSIRRGLKIPKRAGIEWRVAVRVADKRHDWQTVKP